MNQNSIKVLLIEDNFGDARLIQEMLADVNSPPFGMAHVPRLSDGIQRLSIESFDVVLLDLGLPDSQGLETLQRVRERAPACPVIVLTNLDDRETAVQAISAGASDYMVKGKVDSYLLARAILRQVKSGTQAEDGAAD